MGVGAHAVLHALEVATRDRDVPAVGQVPAGGQAHAHHGVAGLAEREVDREVRGRARVRLHVGVVGAEQGLRAIDAQLLDAIDVLLALVVALAGIALAVLVGEHGARRGQHSTRHVVLRRDESNLVALAALLERDELCDLGVDGGEGGGEGRVHGGVISLRLEPWVGHTPVTPAETVVDGATPDHGAASCVVLRPRVAAAPDRAGVSARDLAAPVAAGAPRRGGDGHARDRASLGAVADGPAPVDRDRDELRGAHVRRPRAPARRDRARPCAVQVDRGLALLRAVHAVAAPVGRVAQPAASRAHQRGRCRSRHVPDDRAL